MCDSQPAPSQNQVYRFKFAPEIVTMLYDFGKLHQHVDRKTYKEKWEEWLKTNSDVFEREERRLSELGYEGDIATKMYKSARYYFRNKTTVKTEPKDRRKYVAANMDIIVMMDEHIKTNINTANYRPSTGYDDFCKNNKDSILEAINDFIQEGLTDPSEIQAKIKKTYKNRYFQFIKNKA